MPKLLRAQLDADPTILNSFSVDGWPALILAAWAGKAEAVSALLDAGALLEIRSKSPVALGNTALHAAIANDQVEIVALLLERGANPGSVQSEGGHTPLHIAAHGKRARIATLLLDKGAPVNARDSQGRTALSVALAQHATEVADLLKQRGGVE